MKYLNSNILAIATFSGIMLVFLGHLSARAQTPNDETSGAAFSESINSEFTGNMYFRKGCHVCHSGIGQGGRSGKRLIEPILPKEDFYAIVRRPYGIMPAYSPRFLSDSDLAEIYEFLEAQKSPKVEDIPQLQQLMNEK